MFKLKQYYIFLFIILIDTSCEKEIPSDFNKGERKIVLNSILNPDSLITVSLSESLYTEESFFANTGPTGNYKGIKNAQINIFEDGQLLEKMEYANNGKYIANYHPLLNREYSIEVSAANFPAIQTQSMLPQKIEIDSVCLTSINDQEYYNLNMRLYIDDPENQENYYYLVVLYNYYKLKVSTFGGKKMFISNDPVFIKNVDLKQYYIFNDKLFDGESYSLDIQVTSNTDSYYDTIQYYYYLCSLNYDFYKYLESHNKYVLTTSENNPLPLTEPVEFYNNINNGFGIFAGFQVDIDTFLYIK